MTHLDPDELIDAMEGMLAAERQAHLTSCEECQRKVADLAIALAESTQVSVPEPSPLFWQHFSRRVRVAIEEEPVESRWPSWLRWQVLMPLGVVAMIILALMISVPKEDRSEDAFALRSPDAFDAPAAPDALDASESWTLVADLVGDLNLETAIAAGVPVTPGIAERAVLELSADEQQELTRLLKAELARAKS